MRVKIKKGDTVKIISGGSKTRASAARCIDVMTNKSRVVVQA